MLTDLGDHKKPHIYTSIYTSRAKRTPSPLQLKVAQRGWKFNGKFCTNFQVHKIKIQTLFILLDICLTYFERQMFQRCWVRMYKYTRIFTPEKGVITHSRSFATPSHLPSIQTPHSDARKVNIMRVFWLLMEMLKDVLQMIKKYNIWLT